MSDLKVTDDTNPDDLPVAHYCGMRIKPWPWSLCSTCRPDSKKFELSLRDLVVLANKAPHDPKIMLTQGAERARAQIAKWPKWKQDAAKQFLENKPTLDQPRPPIISGDGY